MENVFDEGEDGDDGGGWTILVPIKWGTAYFREDLAEWWQVTERRGLVEYCGCLNECRQLEIGFKNVNGLRNHPQARGGLQCDAWVRFG